ncbi:MAG: membrane or secreted protein [Rhodobacteraceae bacterium]|nr:membrane or secreted protein [Paracoccaceae bacterium]
MLLNLRNRKAVIISLSVALFVAISFSLTQVSKGETLDFVTIIEETDDYVSVRAREQTGRLYKHFSFGFEDPDFRNWFGERRWKQMTLQSPATPKVADYIALGRAVIHEGADFIDNQVLAERENVAVGQGAARFVAVQPSVGMVTSKADILTGQMWFVSGDDLWFRGRFLFENGVPYSLVDFEDNNVRGSPGIRVVIDGQRYFGVELKAGSKPRLRQQVAEIPLGRWFELVVHIGLDEVRGPVQVWQDGVLVLDGEMQTLPSVGSLLNSFELGITATDMAAVMLLDDVELGHHRPD